MNRRPLALGPLNMPVFLVDRCQALLDNIQQASTASSVLMYAQRAVGFTEALQLLHAGREPCIARLMQ